MDFSISEMDLSICAPKNNHINCIIKILNFVNLSLKENVIISVFILKVPILQPSYLIYKFTKSVGGWVTGRSACVFYGRTSPAYN